jgi:hypothetical protein
MFKNEWKGWLLMALLPMLGLIAAVIAVNLLAHAH